VERGISQRCCLAPAVLPRAGMAAARRRPLPPPSRVRLLVAGGCLDRQPPASGRRCSPLVQKPQPVALPVTLLGDGRLPVGALLPQSYGARLARDSSKDAARSSCKTSCANLQPSLLLSRDVHESIVLSMSTKAHLSEKQMR